MKNFKTDKTYDLMDDVVKIHESMGWTLMPTVFCMSNSKRPGGNKEKEKKDNKPAEEMTYIFSKPT